MIPLRRFFRAERIKWRKSWSLLLALLAPICQTGFLFTLAWFSEAQMKQFKPGFQFWLEVNYLTWGLVMMPMLTALISELSWGLEEESKAWDHLLFQPVSRRTHYLTKIVSHFSLLSVSQILLAIFVVLAGFVLRINPRLGMGEMPWQALISFGGFAFLASISLVAFHTWFSVRVSGLGVGLAAALVGTWLSVRLADVSFVAQIAPWGMASQLAHIIDRSKHLPWVLFLGSLVCAGLFVYLGCVDFERRSESKS
jgi:hypothetical protein